MKLGARQTDEMEENSSFLTVDQFSSKFSFFCLTPCRFI